MKELLQLRKRSIKICHNNRGERDGIESKCSVNNSQFTQIMLN